MKLHKNQKRLLELLKNSMDMQLTVRDIQERLGFSSPNLVQHHINQLETKGFIKRNPYNSRDFQILKIPDSDISYINIYGLAQCGPNGLFLDGNPIDSIPISTKILGFNPEQAFIVKAKGKSMAPKINEGDLVIVKRINNNLANNGDIIVCINDGMALIKKIKFPQNSTSQIILESINSDFSPFIANKNNFKIEGIVKGIFSYQF